MGRKHKQGKAQHSYIAGTRSKALVASLTQVQVQQTQGMMRLGGAAFQTFLASPGGREAWELVTRREYEAQRLEAGAPRYLDLPPALSALASNRWYAPARSHGRLEYRSEVSGSDKRMGTYELGEVLDMVDDLIRPSDRQTAVLLPLVWRVGFVVGWLSGLSVSQPVEAQKGMAILGSLVVPLLCSPR